MADQTSIEWTDATWNPTRGCSRVSAGCKNCYAERVAARFSGPGRPYDGFALGSPSSRHGRIADRGPRWTGRVELVPSQLDLPLRWRKPRRVFVNSMSDLFHEKLSNEDIAAVFGVMAACPQHTFQVLTKRSERMSRWYQHVARHNEAVGSCVWFATSILGRSASDPITTSDLPRWPLPNVWLGVSIEDQWRADERIPHLLATPASVRWVSAEPLLQSVDFENVPVPRSSSWHGYAGTYNALTGRFQLAVGNVNEEMRHARHVTEEACLSWIVVGGESGPAARPFDLAWARSVVAQCRAAGVSCFVKQLGARPFDSAEGGANPWSDFRLRDRKGGDPSEWPEDLRVREWPKGAA